MPGQLVHFPCLLCHQQLFLFPARWTRVNLPVPLVAASAGCATLLRRDSRPALSIWACFLLPVCAGEYGDLLVGPESSKLLEGEEPVSTSEADVVGLLEAVLQVRAALHVHAPARARLFCHCSALHLAT